MQGCGVQSVTRHQHIDAEPDYIWHFFITLPKPPNALTKHPSGGHCVRCIRVLHGVDNARAFMQARAVQTTECKIRWT